MMAEAHVSFDMLGRLIDALQHPALIVEPSARIVRANRSAKNMLGASAGTDGNLTAALAAREVLGNKKLDLHSLLKRAVSAQGVFRQIMELDTPKDGTAKTSVQASLITPPAAGQPALLLVRLVPHGKDVSAFSSINAGLAQKNARLHQALRDQRRMYEEILYAATHDLKNPLMNIRMTAEMLHKSIAAMDDAELFARIDLLQRATLRAQDMVTGLVEFYRVGFDDTIEEQVPLSEMVREIGVAALGRTPRIRLRMDGTLPVVKTRRIPLRSVLYNVIANAAHHHDRDEGEIGVSATIERGAVVIIISDDGPGIADDDKDRVFAPFKSLKPKTVQMNTGMGLTICKRITTLMGGDIWIDDNPGRRGAAVHIRWPTGKQTGTMQPASVSGRATPNNSKD